MDVQRQSVLTSSVFKLSIRNLAELATIYRHCAGTDCVHAAPRQQEVFSHGKNTTICSSGLDEPMREK